VHANIHERAECRHIRDGALEHHAGAYVLEMRDGLGESGGAEATARVQAGAAQLGEDVLDRVHAGDAFFRTALFVAVLHVVGGVQPGERVSSIRGTQGAGNPVGAVARLRVSNNAARERVRFRMHGGSGPRIPPAPGPTAYAFSCGGPVIWPEVEALLLVPVAAHALFTRPLVLGPNSCMEVVVQRVGFGGAEIWCDGRRSLDVPVGARIRVTRAERPVRLARFNQAPFASRLVRKFDLPVEGWRASNSADEAYSPEEDALHQPMVTSVDTSTDGGSRPDSSGGTA